jgi:argininosuccinate lyase
LPFVSDSAARAAGARRSLRGYRAKLNAAQEAANDIAAREAAAKRELDAAFAALAGAT